MRISRSFPFVGYSLVRSFAAQAIGLAVATACFFAPGAQAGTFTFTFSGASDSVTCCASYTYVELQGSYGLQPQLVDISGTFEYDTTTQTISAPSVTLSTASPDIFFAGSSMSFDTIQGQGTFGSAYYLQLGDAAGDAVQFLLDGGLANLNADLSVALDNGGYFTNYTVATPGLYFPVFNVGAQNQLLPATDSLTGFADPSSAPEPTTLFLFVPALASLVVLRRRGGRSSNSSKA
jgi:hypothetical protein